MAAIAIAVAISALVLAGLVAVEVLRRPPQGPQPGTDLVPVATPEPSTDLVVRPGPLALPGETAVEIFGPSATDWLARIEAIDAVDRAQPIESPWLSSLLTAALRQAPESALLLKSTAGLRLVFSPQVMAGLRSGAFSLVETARGPIAMARDTTTGRFVEVGAVAAGGGLATLSLPTILIAGSIAAAAMQQRCLAGSLEAIRSNVERTVERLRDADRGNLDAANELVGHVEAAIYRGVVPDQLRYELATSRTSVNAVYFSRVQYLDRFRTVLEAAQNGKDDGDGRLTTPWVRGSRDAFGEPEDFEAEVLLYLRALVTRARLTGSTAMLLAFEGHAVDALRLVDQTNDEIRLRFMDLSRRMGPLADITPSFWVGRDRKELHGMVTRLEALMAGEIQLALPTGEAPDPVIEILRNMPETAVVTEPQDMEA
jgi:hypothetical protein